MNCLITHPLSNLLPFHLMGSNIFLSTKISNPCRTTGKIHKDLTEGLTIILELYMFEKIIIKIQRIITLKCFINS
jgi:hypothetical protein